MPGQDNTVDKLYKTAEVAAIFGVRTATIREWIKSGKIKAIPTPGGHFRIGESEVRRVANKRFED